MKNNKYSQHTVTDQDHFDKIFKSIPRNSRYAQFWLFIKHKWMNILNALKMQLLKDANYSWIKNFKKIQLQ